MMRRELGVFIEDVEVVDLRVEEGDVPVPARSLSGGYAYDDSTFVVDTRYGRVQLGEGLIRAGSVFPYELLRWVTYAMRRRLLEKDVSALHAAAVARNGQAYVFPAWAQTGKTNLQLNLLAHGYEYMADDWCPVTASGEVLGYPRSVNLLEYNFACTRIWSTLWGTDVKGAPSDVDWPSRSLLGPLMGKTVWSGGCSACCSSGSSSTRGSRCRNSCQAVGPDYARPWAKSAF